jgi:hypothetical protein
MTYKQKEEGCICEIHYVPCKKEIGKLLHVLIKKGVHKSIDFIVKISNINMYIK